ncbi:unnamed protein product [Symbiodinium necroappetens]|uniref:PDZ domain-containing protein n=1 Tax=Symbiodinium necroappetens TaxID=1628268 RepID=A0A813BNK5_9DINO|nr:unnamed protein product [Symbiodinium necroappetens]CAE7947618.1 unnamed protein product [Symbiodinium sp. KB8]|mmetsp:Transcript_81147/g.194721  ORF Transcript_81147/g.194721 Transcript_81147/m.194721 type:complete len:251 (-) Transcript_81147:42-794(-)
MWSACCCNNPQDIGPGASQAEAYSSADDARQAEGSSPFPAVTGVQDDFLEQELVQPAAVVQKELPNLLTKFRATLDKSEGSFGLCLDYEDAELAGTGAGFKDRCLVFNVTGGAAAEWNKGHPDKALQVGDCIAAANGVKGSSKAVFESIRKADKVDLDVERPQEITVAAGKGGRPLGLHLAYADSSVGLIVKQVNEGPVKEWNKAHPSSSVGPGDRILEVNGCRSGIQDRIPELARSQDENVTLRVLSWQ